MINELKEIFKKRAMKNGSIEDIETIEAATTLLELGCSFTDAIKILKDAGEPIVITEEERDARLAEIDKAKKAVEMGEDDAWARENGLTHGRVNMRAFESVSDIVIVHKTDYAPKGERIESRRSGAVLHECSIKLGGKDYPFTCESGRNTVHFSANHEVGENDGGSWDEMKYAVLLPFDDLKKHSEIRSAQAVDVYVEGAVQLTKNAYILCPKGASAAVQKDNPSVTVIEYEGQCVQGYANMLLSELGYKLEIGNDHGFIDRKQADRYYDIMAAEGFSTQSHFYSSEKESETELGIVYQVVGTMQLISDEKLIEKIGRENLINELNEQHFFELVNSVFGNGKTFHNEFVGELKKRGIDVSIDGARNAIESYQDEEGRLVGKDGNFTTLDYVITDYLLNAVSERRIEEVVPEVTPKDIAELDKELGITTSEVGKGEEIINSPQEKGEI